MSEQSQQRYSVQEAFDPELREQQAQFDAYINGRPFQDNDGKLRSPDGKFANADTYFDNRRDEIAKENVESYDTMSMPTLARKLAHAEFNKDTTSAADISDILVAKMAEQADTIRSLRDAEHSADREDNLWNRIMSIKDSEYAKLAGDTEAHTDSESIDAVGANDNDEIEELAPFTSTETGADDIPEAAMVIGRETEAPSKRDRARKLMSKSRTAVGGLLASAGVSRQRAAKTEKSGGKEKSRRNKVVAGVVAGALALGLVAYEANDNDGKASKTASRKPAATAKPTIRPTALQTPAKPTAAAAEQTGLGAPVKLTRGDTIWHEAAVQLKKEGVVTPTDTQIQGRTSRILKANNLTWEQARNLDINTEIK